MDRLLGHRRPDSAETSASRLPLPKPPTREYRSIWISDFHLGTARCKAQALLEFLRGHRAENLFLVGDIIDGWNMGPGWCWTPDQTAVVEEIWSWRRRGTRIVIIPGNHDEHDGELVRMLFGAVECHPFFLHRTADNRRMLVIHGHQFDSPIHGNRWFSVVGSIGYSRALKINLWYNRNVIHSNPESGSKLGVLRRRLKLAVHQLVDFPDARVTHGARQHRADGVICGHTHRPDQRMIGPILYLNDGDWVQSRTALIEERGGELNLLRWSAQTHSVSEGMG
jgi:UDP-2,3-diacylglucosamine pyrophosphatase LpxH